MVEIIHQIDIPVGREPLQRKPDIDGIVKAEQRNEQHWRIKHHQKQAGIDLQSTVWPRDITALAHAAIRSARRVMNTKTSAIAAIQRVKTIDSAAPIGQLLTAPNCS
jgi:hypothetical protein